MPNGSIAAADFEIQLGHVFAHLNRAWNSRNRIGEADDQQLEAETQFPSDLVPNG